MSTEAFLKMPYHRVLVFDSENNLFAASVREFPGCLAQGATQEEALADLDDAMIEWSDALTESGRTLPKPFEESQYSGRTMVRMAKSLHRKAALAADSDGVSLNQFIATALAIAVGIKAQPMQQMITIVLGRDPLERLNIADGFQFTETTPRTN